MYCLVIGCKTLPYPFQLWFWKCAGKGFMPFFNTFISNDNRNACIYIINSILPM